MRILISIIIIFSCSETFAQNWAKVSNDKFAQSLDNVLYDSIHNKLIVSGKGINHIGNLSARGVVSWDGIKWDSLTGGINTHNKSLQSFPNGALGAGIPYNSKLLVGGYFTSIGDVNTTGLALWDGNKWDSLPKRPFRYDKTVVVSNFLKKGNVIYFTGSFDTIAGQSTTGIASWNGTNFNPITLPIHPTNFNGITSIVEYQNEIYVAGGYFMGNVGDVLKYNGTSWVSTTGGGFLGPYSGARQLIVYNNELYAAGYFEQANGNPGNNVIKWDGSQWHDAGFGTIGSYIEINKMLVYHNKLWVFGYIPKVAGTFAGNVAVYDGTSWCGLKDTLDNTIGSATVYNDTIYIGGGFWKANSDSIPFIAKLSDANLFNQCVNVVGVNELNNNQISVYPNPTASIINILDENNQLQNATIQITDYLGQLVYNSSFTTQINMSDFSSGMYFLIIQDGYYKKTVKVIKE
jgi:hypothetical protein